MFKRRKPLTLFQITKQLFWPDMGWRRAFIYTKHKLVRLSGTTHSIALGLAIGTGVSFSPILGIHFVQAAIIAWLLRANIFASMVGTFVGNPWTFPFIWWGGLSLGKYLFGVLGINGAGHIPDDLSLAIIWDMMLHDPLTIFFPWMLGGYLLVFLTIPISYPIYYLLIKEAKIVKEKAKEIAAKRRKKKQ